MENTLLIDLLKLLDRRVDIQAIGRVLRSPWLRGAQSERNQRALLEKCLRDNYPRQLKLDDLIFCIRCKCLSFLAHIAIET